MNHRKGFSDELSIQKGSASKIELERNDEHLQSKDQQQKTQNS